MTIDIGDEARYKQYVATSGQTVFTADFVITATTDASVYQRIAGSDPSDVADILLDTVDYVITGAGASTGFTVTLNVGAVTGDIVSIAGNEMPLARTAVFSLTAPISSETLDEEFNGQLLMTQQLNTKMDERQIQYQYSATVDTTIDRRLPVLGASQAWVMNSTRTGIEALTIEETGTAALLRADLANDESGSDGARLVGYFSSVHGATTVRAILNEYETHDHLPFSDNVPLIKNSTVHTKQIRISAANITLGNTRVLTMPDKNVDLDSATAIKEGLILLAETADLKAGVDASKAVTVNTMRYYPALSKASAHFSVTHSGIVTINKSTNITSIVRTATGTYTITFASAFADAFYNLVGSSRDGPTTCHHVLLHSATANSCVLLVVDVNDVLRDSDGYVSIEFFGDLA